MTMNQLSVRQCGPQFSVGVAREIRRGLQDDSVRAINAVFGPFERRRSRLRRLEAERLVRLSVRQLEPVAIGPAQHVPNSARRMIVFVEGSGLAIGWARFSIVTFPRGGHQVCCELVPAARLSGHALQRLILRLSTREWPLILRELAAMETMCAAATTAVSRGWRAFRVPTEHGALVVACDEPTPTIVTFLDDLSARKASHAVAEFSLLLQPGGHAAPTIATGGLQFETRCMGYRRGLSE